MTRNAVRRFVKIIVFFGGVNSVNRNRTTDFTF